MRRISIPLRHNRPGQMLLEVIIAMGVLVLFATAFVTLVLTAYEGRGRAENRIVGTYAAWEGLEAARSLGWGSFGTLQDGTYGFDDKGSLMRGSGSRLEDRFSQRIDIVSLHTSEESTEADDVHQTKHVESTVSWALSEGKHAKVTLETFLTSWRKPRWLMDIASDFEQGGINAIRITDEGDGGVAIRSDGNFLRPEVVAQIPVTSRIQNLHVDPISDLLYVLTDENPLGPELLVYDVSNVSSGSGTLTLVAEAELIKNGIAFAFGEKYAYILTAHSDQEVVVLRLSDNAIVNAWDIEGEAYPRDIAIDETTDRAYVTLSTAEERIPLVVARAQEEPLPVTRLARFLQRFSSAVTTILAKIPGIDTVLAQGAPTCNGSTATIYVSGGFVVGGPDNGLAYVAGVTTLRGNNAAGSTDVIVGTSGNDTIQGRNGIDIICGGLGNDNIDGGSQDDIILSEDGNDTIAGSNNNDTICAGNDTDTLNGGSGNDAIDGGAGTDTLTGGAGTDICRRGETLLTCEDTTSAIATCGVGAADTTPPTVSTLSPADNATGTSPTANLVITFSEAVTAVSGNITIKKTSDNSTVETIAVTSGLVTGGGTSTVTIDPATTLTGLTSYYVLIDATAFDDLAGNGYAGISSTTAWNFTTASTDTAPPTVSTLSPADNATGASPTANLVITFNEAVTAVSGNVTIKKTSDNSTVEAINVTSGQVTGGGTATITVNPSSDLGYSTDYYAQIDATAFDDLAGNGFTGINDTTTWNFTTSAEPDTTPPTISTLSPADEATGVSFNPTLTITFSEAVTAVSGNVTIKKSSDNSTVEAISVTSGQLTGSGTATISLSTSVILSSLTAYYIHIDASAFDDLAGNGFAGISDTTTWNFTTASSDTTNPSITTLSPSDDATDVAQSTDLVITFNETVSVESGNITVKKLSDGSTVDTIGVTTSQVTGDGTSTITVELSNDLERDTVYYVNVDATAFDDLVGNSFAGISDETTWNFTTAEEVIEVQNEQVSKTERMRRVARKVYVFDVSDPEATNAEAQVAQVEIGDFGEEVEVFGGFVFLAASDIDVELRILDAETLMVERCDLPGRQLIMDMHIRGNLLYITRAEGEEEEFLVYEIDERKPGDCDTLLGNKIRGIELSDEARNMALLPQGDVAFVLGTFMESAVQVIDVATKEREGLLGQILAPLATAQSTTVSFLQGFNGICDSIETVGAYLFAGCRMKEGKTVLTITGGKRGSEERFQRGTFTAAPFDSESSGTVWRHIAWKNNNENPARLRVRMAATKEGLQTALWVGADGLRATPFTSSAGEFIVVPSGASGTRWIQWKAYFENNTESVSALEDVILTFDQPQ